jgi:hypothetical protein
LTRFWEDESDFGWRIYIWNRLDGWKTTWPYLVGSCWLLVLRRSEGVESVGRSGFWPDTGRFAFLTASALRPLAIAFRLAPAAANTTSGNELDNI